MIFIQISIVLFMLPLFIQLLFKTRYLKSNIIIKNEKIPRMDFVKNIGAIWVLLFLLMALLWLFFAVIEGEANLGFMLETFLYLFLLTTVSFLLVSGKYIILWFRL